MSQTNNEKKQDKPCPHCGALNERTADRCEACGKELPPPISERLPLREQFPKSAAYFARRAKLYAWFSLLSFIIGLLSLGFFGWFTALLVDIWPGVSPPIALSLNILFFLITLGGLIIGIIGYEQGKKIIRFLGPIFNLLGTLFLGCNIFAQIYFMTGPH